MEQLVPWSVFCLAVLLLCLLRPQAGRVFLGLFFLAMAIGANVVLVLVAPEQFVALGTDAPVFWPYEWFFENVVALAPPLFGLLAASYEISIAVMLLSGGKYARWGLIGGVVFLIGITPLGVWTLANPILALALVVLLTKGHDRSRESDQRKIHEPAKEGPGR